MIIWFYLRPYWITSHDNNYKQHNFLKSHFPFDFRATTCIPFPFPAETWHIGSSYWRLCWTLDNFNKKVHFLPYTSITWFINTFINCCMFKFHPFFLVSQILFAGEIILGWSNNSLHSQILNSYSEVWHYVNKLDVIFVIVAYSELTICILKTCNMKISIY